MMLQIVSKDTAVDSLTPNYLRNLRMGCFVLFSEGNMVIHFLGFSYWYAITATEDKCLHENL